MLLRAFTVLDVKTGIHNVPFFVPHPGIAHRMFADLAGDMSTSIGRHPADYVLVEIGSYDDNTGRFENDQQVHHGNAAGYLNPSPPLPFGQKE